MFAGIDYCRICRSIACLVFLGPGMVFSAETSPLPVIPGELVVTLDHGANEGQVLEQLKAKGVTGSVVARTSPTNTILIKLTGDESASAHKTNAALQAAFDLDGVIHAEPNVVYRLTQSPDDPLLNSMAYLSRIGAQKAWDSTSPSEDIVVAVVDTGVMLNHEDIVQHIWKNPNVGQGGKGDCEHPVNDRNGWNFIDCNNSPVPADASERHGTNVAGIIGATGNNHIGGLGVAWKTNVKLMALRACAVDCNLFAAVSAINYAVAHNARVINLSWGAPTDAAQLRMAIEAAGEKGVLVVAAAGNGDSNQIGQDNDSVPFYPASYNLPNLISVAATGPEDALTSFSNFGKTSVHIGAPGLDITGPIPLQDAKTGKVISGYKALTGTSQAAPLVTGTIALILTQNPNATIGQVRGFLLNFGDIVAALEKKISSGRRLNIGAAVAAASNAATLASLDPETLAHPPPPLVALNAQAARPKTPFKDISTLTIASGEVPATNNTVYLSNGTAIVEPPKKQEWVVTLTANAKIGDVVKELNKFKELKSIIPSKGSAYGDPRTHNLVIQTNESAAYVKQRLDETGSFAAISPSVRYQLQQRALAIP